MNVQYKMVVDFARPSKTNSIIISEGDVNSRVCCFTLLFDKQPFGMIDVSVATIRAVKQNGSVIYGDAEIMTDDTGSKLNEIRYTIPGEMADEAGKVTMTITLMSSTGEQITSFEFYMTVRNALYNEDDYVSREDLSGFRDLLNRSMSALEKMEVMTAQDALPSPYALTVNLEGEEKAYNGSEALYLNLGKLVHLRDSEGKPEASIDETAAAAAAKSAAEAEDSAARAALSASTATDNAEATRVASISAGEYMTLAKGYQGQAAASAVQAQEIADVFKNDIERIKKAIRDLGGTV